MRRLAGITAALAIAAGTLLLTPPGAALATPSDCDAWIDPSTSPDGGWAQCTSGDGHFRAMVYCTSNPQSGYGAYYYGDWVRPAPNVSAFRACPESRPYAVAAGYDLANW